MRFLAEVPLSKCCTDKKRHLLSRERARQAATVARGGVEGLARYIKFGISQAYARRAAARNTKRLLTPREESTILLTTEPGS